MRPEDKEIVWVRGIYRRGRDNPLTGENMDFVQIKDRWGNTDIPAYILKDGELKTDE